MLLRYNGLNHASLSQPAFVRHGECVWRVLDESMSISEMARLRARLNMPCVCMCMCVKCENENSLISVLLLRLQQGLWEILTPALTVCFTHPRDRPDSSRPAGILRHSRTSACGCHTHGRTVGSPVPFGSSRSALRRVSAGSQPVNRNRIVKRSGGVREESVK